MSASRGANLVGQLNDGWRVTTTTLSNERGTTGLAMMVPLSPRVQ